MTTQLKAQRLADELDQYLYSVPAHPLCTDAAAELRRLHEESEMHAAAYFSACGELRKVEAQRDALLEALNDIANTDPVDAALDPQRAVRIARAAIKAVEETK